VTGVVVALVFVAWCWGAFLIVVLVGRGIGRRDAQRDPRDGELSEADTRGRYDALERSAYHSDDNDWYQR